MNTFKVGLLLAALTGRFLAAGFLIGGQQGMVIAFGIAVATNAFAYWNADKMVLSMYGERRSLCQQPKGEDASHLSYSL